MMEHATGEDRAAYVTRTIQANRDAAVSPAGSLLHYDVESITGELDQLYPDYDEIPQETFWEVVEKHHRHGEGRRA
jgi:hypothetical protein